MSLQERVYSVLVVSCFDSFNTAVTDMLALASCDPVVFAGSVSEAKRRVADRSFDFVIINSPLPDESGMRFAIDSCRSPNTVVLILVKNELHAEMYEKVAAHGVFTLPKPTARTAMLQALAWMTSARERLRQLEQKTLSVEEKMQEIRIINRAKCVLISQLRMTEPDAHRYIEKTAMDSCITRKEVAENILQTYR